MLRAIFFATIWLMIVATCRTGGGPTNQDKKMNNEAQHKLLQVVGNSQIELQVRLRALQDLGLLHTPSLVAALKDLLQRRRPEPKQRTINWDPQAAERVVDLHIVETLHQLGDNSELNRIANLVRQAGKILQGPDDELLNAASVIRTIDRPEPISALITLASDNDPQAVRNAVRTLDQLNLPEPPVHQSVASVSITTEKLTFTIHTLKEEMETLVSLSHGVIVLSPGVNLFLVKNNYERGKVRRENVTLCDIIEKDLSELEFDYFIEGNHVVICTYSDAGERWRNWSKNHSASERVPIGSS